MEKKKFIVYYENGEKLEVLHELNSLGSLVGYLIGLLALSFLDDKIRIETK